VLVQTGQEVGGADVERSHKKDETYGSIECGSSRRRRRNRCIGKERSRDLVIAQSVFSSFLHTNYGRLTVVVTDTVLVRVLVTFVFADNVGRIQEQALLIFLGE
jgi:hypothetical protein